MPGFEFKAIIASRGYHVFKDTTWSGAKVNDPVKIELETNPNSILVTRIRMQSEHSTIILAGKLLGISQKKYRGTFTSLSTKKPCV